jgi:hypothetical protein
MSTVTAKKKSSKSKNHAQTQGVRYLPKQESAKVRRSLTRQKKKYERNNQIDPFLNVLDSHRQTLEALHSMRFHLRDMKLDNTTTLHHFNVYHIGIDQQERWEWDSLVRMLKHVPASQAGMRAKAEHLQKYRLVERIANLLPRTLAEARSLESAFAA